MSSQGLAALEDATNRYTGLFSEFRRIPLRTHCDPIFSVYGAELAREGKATEAQRVGGAGWSDTQARLACLGEGFERFGSCPDSADRLITSSFDAWQLPETPISPLSWVLFSENQYATHHFPFVRLTSQTVCSWTRCRDLSSGDPVWVPVDFVFLNVGHDLSSNVTPQYSTGLSAATDLRLAITRGLQENIERDGIINAWWGHYPIEELCSDWVFDSLAEVVPKRNLQRPNLEYRFFRVKSPFSNNITMVTLQGEDYDRTLFSIGSACRESLLSSFEKSLLEALQGRVYVRALCENVPRAAASVQPTTFAEHASYYSLNLDQLAGTALYRAPQATPPVDASRATEPLVSLTRSLGASRPVLWRLAGNRFLRNFGHEWIVVKVVVPDLQPLHGHQGLPHLGGKQWETRLESDYSRIGPHPFP